MPKEIKRSSIWECGFCPLLMSTKREVVNHEKADHKVEVSERRIRECVEDYKVLNGLGPGGQMNWGYGDGYFGNHIRSKYPKKVRYEALKRLNILPEEGD